MYYTVYSKMANFILCKCYLTLKNVEAVDVQDPFIEVQMGDGHLKGDTGDKVNHETFLEADPTSLDDIIYMCQYPAGGT